MIRLNLSVFAAVTVLLAGGPLLAATYTWNVPNTAYWESVGFWGGTFPTLSDDVVVNNPGGAENTLVVAPPSPTPGSWTGTGYSRDLTMNSTTPYTVNLAVLSTLISSNVAINNKASALVSGGSWTVFGGVSLDGAQSSLTVANSGSLSSNAGSIGNGAGAVGTATVMTNGLWFNDANLSVGSNGGTGLLQVNSGGTVRTDGSVFIDNGSSVSLFSTGASQGVLSTYSVVKSAGSATLGFNGGILQARRDEANFISGFAANEVGIANEGAYIDSNGHNIGISAAFYGQGSLVKIGTGTLTLSGSNTYGGHTVVRTGALVVSGASNSPSGNVGVGVDSGNNGSLRVESGGAITSATTRIGIANGSTGSVTVTSGTWSNSGDFAVAESGSGTLLVNGGQLTANQLFVGVNATGNGSATVSSGSLTSNGSLQVGKAGQGSLAISGSGAVTSADGYLGSDPGGNGTVTVSGGTWVNTGVYVGMESQGTLSVSGGTVTTNGNGIVGTLAGSSGVATISGTGVWDNTGYLIAGYASTGTVHVNGGTVYGRTGTVVGYGAGGTGTINVAGGTLATPFILEQGAGVGSLNLNGGTLRATANSGDFLQGFEAGDVTVNSYTNIDTGGFAVVIQAAIDGAGGLIKKGAGTLTLTATNTYTGQTTVDEGTLLITGNNTANFRIMVDAHATLGGTGMVGDVYVGDLGTLSPGLSPGLLTINGDLTMEPNSILKMEFNATTVGAFDQLAVGGLFDAAGAILNLEMNYTASLGDTFVIFTDELPSLNDFTIVSNLGGGLAWDTSKLASEGRVTVVPEPSSALLLILGAGALIARRRKLRVPDR